MSHQDNMRDLKRAAAQMEHHAEIDYHPELNWGSEPTSPAGSIESYSWTEDADVWVRNGEKFGNHGKK